MLAAMEGITINFSDIFSATVKVGNYGKFVQIKKHAISVKFSKRSMRCIADNALTISLSFEVGSDFRLWVSAVKDIQLREFQGQKFLTLHEFWGATSANDRYLNLTQEEWKQLAASLPRLEEILQYDVVYAKKSDVKPLFGARPDFWLLEKECRQNAIEDGYKSRLIPRMSELDINMLLMAYRIRKNISKVAEKSCAGCNAGSLSERDHTLSCLEGRWLNMVKCHYDAAKKGASIKEEIRRLNEEMDWQVPLMGGFDDMALHKLVESYEDDKPCQQLASAYEDAPDIVLIYQRLFSKLFISFE